MMGPGSLHRSGGRLEVSRIELTAAVAFVGYGAPRDRRLNKRRLRAMRENFAKGRRWDTVKGQWIDDD